MTYEQLGTIFGILGLIGSALGSAVVFRMALKPGSFRCQVLGHNGGATCTSEEGHYYARCDRCGDWHPEVRT